MTKPQYRTMVKTYVIILLWSVNFSKH